MAAASGAEIPSLTTGTLPLGEASRKVGRRHQAGSQLRHQCCGLKDPPMNFQMPSIHNRANGPESQGEGSSVQSREMRALLIRESQSGKALR